MARERVPGYRKLIRGSSASLTRRRHLHPLSAEVPPAAAAAARNRGPPTTHLRGKNRLCTLAYGFSANARANLACRPLMREQLLLVLCVVR